MNTKLLLVGLVVGVVLIGGCTNKSEVSITTITPTTSIPTTSTVEPTTTMEITSTIKEIETTSIPGLGECTTNTDCGTDGYETIKEEVCYDEITYRQYISYRCENPGTPEAKCVGTEKLEKLNKRCRKSVSKLGCVFYDFERPEGSYTLWVNDQRYSRYGGMEFKANELVIRGCVREVNLSVFKSQYGGIDVRLTKEMNSTSFGGVRFGLAGLDESYILIWIKIPETEDGEETFEVSTDEYVEGPLDYKFKLRHIMYKSLPQNQSELDYLIVDVEKPDGEIIHLTFGNRKTLTVDNLVVTFYRLKGEIVTLKVSY